MLTGLFMLWTLFIIWKRGFRSHAADFRYSVDARSSSRSRRSRRSSLIIFGVMYVLYGGVATPSEAAGVGAALCVVLRGRDLPDVAARSSGGRSCATRRASR